MMSVSSNKNPSFSQYSALLGRYLLPQRGRVGLMALLLLAGIALQLASPQVIRYFLDTAQDAGTAGGATGRTLLTAALIYIAFALAEQGMSVAANYASSLVSWTATNRLRTDLALHLLRLDMTFHKQHTPGELIERIDGDVNYLGNFFSQMVVKVLGNLLLLAGILGLLFVEDARVGGGMALYTAVIFLILLRVQRIAVPYFQAYRQSYADLFGFVEERITGAEDIRVNGAEEAMLARLFRLMRNQLIRGRRSFVVSSLAWNITTFLYVIGFALGLGLAVSAYLRGDATLGTAYLIVHYVGMLDNPLRGLIQQAEDLQQATAAIQRVEEFLNLRPLVAVSIDPVRIPDGALPVAFDRVTFAYDDNETDNVLQDVTFRLEPGEVLGILGRTGSGKSTMTRLLFHLYDPTGGQVCLGGVDLRQTRLEDLRGRVGMVTQDVQLFQASVRDNLTFFDTSISDAQLEQILRELRLWDWVASLPDGLDTRLGTGGQGLSAGEAQLLAFARVFLKDPGLVVLDEASSRLDPATETRMERAIDRLFEGRTGIIIAHRLKTVQRANRILILEGGRVVEYGLRAELARDPHSHFARLLQTGLEEVLA